jgi:uncharacterized protein (DUF486 family)
MLTILLLTVSNIFMTIAWYGHLKHTTYPLWKTILISWLIAFVEYCFQVPANRYGYTLDKFSAPQLKVIQEVITLVVFGVFTTFVLKDKLHWNHLVGFLFILLAVFFVFHNWDRQPTEARDVVQSISANLEQP